MQTSDQLRHQIIKNLIPPHSAKTANALVLVWEQLSTQIISIVGIGGFNSLYARSIYLSQQSFPWLEDCILSAQSGHRFVDLKKCLEGQTAEHAIAANNLLLITLTDIMASIIGDQLTNNILHTAWGDVALDKNGKELKNE
jgi:hypothetical protein